MPGAPRRKTVSIPRGSTISVKVLKEILEDIKFRNGASRILVEYEILTDEVKLTYQKVASGDS